MFARAHASVDLHHERCETCFEGGLGLLHYGRNLWILNPPRVHNVLIRKWTQNVGISWHLDQHGLWNQFWGGAWGTGAVHVCQYACVCRCMCFGFKGQYEQSCANSPQILAASVQLADRIKVSDRERIFPGDIAFLILTYKHWLTVLSLLSDPGSITMYGSWVSLSLIAWTWLLFGWSSVGLVWDLSRFCCLVLWIWSGWLAVFSSLDLLALSITENPMFLAPTGALIVIVCY